MNLKDHFPRASKSFLDANEVILEGMGHPNTHRDDKNPVQPIVATPRRGRMNNTEAEYSMILEARKRKGEILHWEFEGITLRWEGVSFTPDFTVIEDMSIHPSAAAIRFIEVKGSFIGGNRARAVERFRHARTYWGKYFTFQLWQKTKDGWGTPRI